MELNFDALPDTTLFELMKADHSGAFDTLYNRHWESLYLRCYSVLKDQTACEDIVQEVFYQVWKTRKGLVVHQPGGYLHMSVRNGVFKVLQSKKLEEKHLHTLTTVELLNKTEEDLDVKEMETRILAYLEDLPDKCREIFYLSRFEDLSNKEIAQKLQISTRTVENQIHRALKHLKKLLPHLMLWHLLVSLN